MTFSEEVWRTRREAERFLLELRREARRHLRRAVRGDRELRKAVKAAQRRAEEIERRRRAAVSPGRYYRVDTSRVCKNSDCDDHPVTSRAYCSDACRVHHRTRRAEARAMMVQAYKRAIDEGWYQLPTAEAVADAFLDTSWVADTTRPDVTARGQYEGKVRFRATDPLRSRAHAEHVLMLLRRAGRL